MKRQNVTVYVSEGAAAINTVKLSGWNEATYSRLRLLTNEILSVVKFVLRDDLFEIGHVWWLQLNFGFLCNILRALIFQLHSHPQEPSNFRSSHWSYVNASRLHTRYCHSHVYRYRVGQRKWTPNALHITWSNIGRFSKFFHCNNLQKICNAAVIKYPTTPQTRRYTPLWNVCQRTNVSCAMW